MVKEKTLWFPHDINCADDVKMLAMIADYGALGYGLYWRIVEMLHKEESNQLPMKSYTFKAIAKQMLTGAKQTQANAEHLLSNAKMVQEFVETCIKEYELFKTDTESFWASRVNKNIKFRQETSKKRSEAGKMGAIAKQNLASAKQMGGKI